MALPIHLGMVLAISFFIYGLNSQACPQSVAHLLETTLANYTTWPGIQLTLSSRQCSLDCTISVQSNAPEFADEPDLLDDTPYRLASITKTYTAVAILKLVERGQIDVHAPAVRYLPTWAIEMVQLSQGAEDAGKITTWHLLHHTSGLGDFATGPSWMEAIMNDPQHVWTPQSVIEWSTLYSAPVGYPGELFHYTDTGYTLLGLILENVTRTDLAAAVRDLARFDKLDMPSTWWELLEPEPQGSMQRAGQYYETIDITHFNPSFDLYGAGGLVSNSKDMNHFGRALYEGRLLDETTTRLLYDVESSGYYGSGIVNYSFAGQQAWGHTGFWHTWLYWVPSLDVVITGASNQAAGDLFDAEVLVQTLMDNGCVPVSTCKPRVWT